jgi:NAD(P)-dependent dehydrogenase (short-subunit alcohol dehydrogenase family)
VRLDGKAAVVTGAASGIGRAVVHAFVEAGARVLAFDRDAEQLEALRSDGVGVVAGDVRSPDDNARAAAACAEAFGRLDVFVGNAGVFDRNATLESLEPEELEGVFGEIYGVNVLGYLQGVRACLPGLSERGGAVVLTVSNSAFHAGSGGGILYASSKSAVVGVIHQLAWELAPGIRVNGVSPGGTLTGLRVGSSLGGGVHFSDPARSEAAIRSGNPLRVLPTPEDHAPLYVLLASDASRVMTGTILESDGGLSVRGVGEAAR